MAAERGNALFRTLDYYAGIPLIVLLAAARRLRRRTPPSRIRRVGFMRTGGIGDIVLLSGVIQDVVAMPGVEVHLFTGRANAAAARLIPGITQVHALPLTRPDIAVRMVRSVPLDVLFDTGSWPRVDAIFAAVSRAKWTVGFRGPAQHRHFAHDVVVDHSSALHELDNFRQLVAAAGFTSRGLPRLGAGEPVPPELLPGRPYVVCHLWSGGYMGERKEWPLDRWRAVIAHVVAAGYDVVFTGGPETRADTGSFHATLGDARPAVHDRAGRLRLAQTLELLRKSALVISVNTGVMHMAAAAGVPVISLEGPVPVHRWGPLGERAVSVVSRHPGAGYLNLGWEYDGAPADTMEAIAVDDVTAAVDRLLPALV